MPTSYTTTVAVTGYIGGYTYGSQLDSLTITTGSTNPYELPQPPSAQASFIGLPTLYGVELTPDWWIGKEATFTITPQGATGTVTWTGIVQGYTCSPVQTSSTDQIVELDLLGATSRLSTELIYGDLTIGGVPYWTTIPSAFNQQLAKTTWDEVPSGMTWDKAEGTWDTFTNNKSNLTFTSDTIAAFRTTDVQNADLDGQDILSVLTTLWSNKLDGWFWFDDKTITLNSPSAGYTNYTAITSLDATSCVLWSSLNSAQNFGNIINNATVTNYDASSTSAFLDSTSYNANGNRYQDFGVSYENSVADRLQVITDKINAYKEASNYLQSLTIDLDALTHVAGEWQNFYKSTKPVRLPLTNIPDAYGGNHTYMIRGVQLNLTQKHAEATLLVVPSTIYNPS